VTVRDRGKKGYGNRSDAELEHPEGGPERGERSESKLPDDEQKPHSRPIEWEELAQASSERRARRFQFSCHSTLEVNELFGQWRIVFVTGEWKRSGDRRPTGSPKDERSESKQK
jgi:hypothetical protein